jgi:hypothetical protein
MVPARIAAFLVLIAAAGCTEPDRGTPREAPQPAATQEEGAGRAKPPLQSLASLETQLQETRAIGVLTRTTLVNQVRDLRNRFRERYKQEPAEIARDRMRPPYELLIFKVLSLLQDIDSPLARAVVDSREAIWSALADPDKPESP